MPSRFLFRNFIPTNVYGPLYCSVKCKNNEKKYKKRDTLRFNKNKEYVKNILNQFKGGLS